MTINKENLIRKNDEIIERVEQSNTCSKGINFKFNCGFNLV